MVNSLYTILLNNHLSHYSTFGGRNREGTRKTERKSRRLMNILVKTDSPLTAEKETCISIRHRLLILIPLYFLTRNQVVRWKKIKTLQINSDETAELEKNLSERKSLRIINKDQRHVLTVQINVEQRKDQGCQFRNVKH
jgi:hypothetical protein